MGSHASGRTPDIDMMVKLAYRCLCVNEYLEGRGHHDWKASVS